MLHYNPEFKVDNNEVRRGIYGCLDRLEGNNDEISKIDTQIEDFESKSWSFGSQIGQSALKIRTPGQWRALKAKKIVILVLCLASSSSSWV